MRRLTLTVTPEQAGRTVRSLLRRELHMADGAIARVKTVPDGICLSGAHARTVDRVAAGDVLTVRIDDKRSGGKFTPVAVPLDILYEDADLLALNKPAGMAVHGGYDRGDDKDDYHRVGKLLKKPPDERFLLCLCQFVFAVFLKTAFGLGLRKSVFRALRPLKHLADVFKIVLQFLCLPFG